VEFRIANTRADMRRVAERLDEFAAAQHLPAAVRHDLNVVLDEVLNNVISYGYPAGAQDEIVVRLICGPEAVVIEIDDGAVPFDPRDAPKADLGTELSARKVGGLGWHFVKNLMDEVSYLRMDNRNRLRLVKKLPAGEQ
jgi:anti-sigma regulatory factor (Ser/Thr protein kinase)